MLGASVGMGAFLCWAGGDVETWLARGAVERILALGGCVVGGGVIYFAVLWLLGARASDFRMQTPVNS